jgi:DNA-binding CsgD family transcriptional regulator
MTVRHTDAGRDKLFRGTLASREIHKSLRRAVVALSGVKTEMVVMLRGGRSGGSILSEVSLSYHRLKPFAAGKGIPHRGRGEAEQLLALVGDAYDAALDPALWPSVLEGLCVFTRASMANLFSQDVVNHHANRYFTWGGDPFYMDLYLEKYAALNPLFPRALSIPVGGVLAQTDIMSHAEYRETRFYKEWAKPQGYIDFAGVNIEKVASSIAWLAVVRHERNGFVDAEMRRRMRLLAPHIRRAVLIGKVIDLNKVHATAFTETIDGLASGVFLVDGESALIHANASGQAMLELGEPLKLVNGSLVIIDEAAGRALKRTFTAARTGDAAIESGGIAVPIRGRARGEHFIAHVLPLSSGARREVGAGSRAAAALFVRKASIDLPAAIKAAEQLYRFTPAEVRVLRVIIEVGGVLPVAAMLGTSPSTVKTHLEHLFAKTGTRRQAELVRLIAGFESPGRRPKQR